MSTRPPLHYPPASPVPSSHSFDLFPSDPEPAHDDLRREDIPTRKSTLQVVPDQGVYPKYAEHNTTFLSDGSPESPQSARAPGAAPSPVVRRDRMASSAGLDFDDDEATAARHMQDAEPDGTLLLGS